jgi:hypothetical protein
MSRSGYSDDLDQQALAMWRGAVNSAIRGRRGQKLLADLIAALDAMPTKTLIAHELQTESGEVCALGAVGVMRGMNLSDVEPTERYEVAEAFDIAPALAAEVAYVNDEQARYSNLTPEQRWKHVRDWAVANLRSAAA